MTISYQLDYTQKWKNLLCTKPTPLFQMLIPDSLQHIQMPTLHEYDVHRTISTHLELQKRTLTMEQHTKIRAAFKECPLPLYLKLCIDEACRYIFLITFPTFQIALKVTFMYASRTVKHVMFTCMKFLQISRGGHPRGVGWHIVSLK